MQDPPPADIKPEVKAKYSDRYREITTASTYYMFMNTRVPPFDDPKVREAVNWGIDKPGLARLFAGEVAPGCSFLPPGMPGYDEALDVEDCPWGNPNEPPDLEKARADDQGRRRGRHGRDRLRQQRRPDRQGRPRRTPTCSPRWASTPSRRSSTAASTSRRSATQKTKAQTGFANWFQDFPHPKNFLFLVDGKSIQPTNNQNFGNVDDPEITKGIAELNKEPELTDEVDGAVEGPQQEAGRAGVDRSRTATASSRRSSRSGWTSTTARASTRSTSTTTRASASSRTVDRFPRGGRFGALPVG